MSYARFGGCRRNILRDPECGHKNGNVNVEVIGLRWVLTQVVEGIVCLMQCLMVLDIIVDERIRVDIQI